MEKAFGIWSLVLTAILLMWGYEQLPHRGGDDPKNPLRETHSAWPGVALIVLALLVFLGLWLFVSGVLAA
jgi:hypothetical protein